MKSLVQFIKESSSITPNDIITCVTKGLNLEGNKEFNKVFTKDLKEFCKAFDSCEISFNSKVSKENVDAAAQAIKSNRNIKVQGLKDSTFKDAEDGSWTSKGIDLRDPEKVGDINIYTGESGFLVEINDQEVMVYSEDYAF